MPRAGIFVLLWSLMTCSLGFTMDRSGLILFTRHTAPSLDTYRRISVEPPSNNKTPTTSTDKFWPVEDAKVPMKVKDGMQESQTRERRSTTENIGIKFISDAGSTVKRDDSLGETSGVHTTPRNVVLLLIDNKDLDENRKENLWRDLATEMPLFTVQGSLQSYGDKIGIIDTSSGNTQLSEGKEKDCDCERLLYSNIGELLSWAKYTRQMATGTVSGSKPFNTPLLLDYVVGSSDILTGFDGSNQGEAKLELRKNKRDSGDSWQEPNLADRAKFIPTLLAPELQRRDTTNYDSAWSIFDVLSKIKMAFFRSLLESLGRKDGTFKDIPPPFPLKPTVTNLIRNIIEELKFTSKHQGYVLIAVIPRNELVAVINFFQSEISADTLLVVTETCSGNNKTIIPFAARGSNEQVLREAKTIWQLPAAIRNAIAGGCHDRECPSNRQRRDVPAVSHALTEISAQESLTSKSIIRDKNASEVLDATNVEETTIAEKQARSSTPSETTSYNPVTLFGVATSLLAVAALTPS